MSDLISRQAAIDIERNATVDTNPMHFEAHQKFTQFMDDAEISSFGRWQWSNGFNTALTAVGIDLKKLPPAQPEPLKITIDHAPTADELERIKQAMRNTPVMLLPSAQPEITDCYYCHEDSDGYVYPIEKNNHAFVRFGMDGWELSLKAKGWHGSAKIRYCPMCGRRLGNE